MAIEAREAAAQEPPCAVTMAPALATLEPYDPGYVAADVLVSANENTYGVPDAVRAAMLEAAARVELNRYPDPMANALRDAIAEWHGLAREQVVVGNGGDEIIFNLLLAFGGPGRTLVNCPPTFSIYALYAQITGTSVVNVARVPDTFAIDEDAVCAAAGAADIVFITTPNNPTGTLARPEFIARLCAACPSTLVVADEAYVEFSDEGASCVPLLHEYGNLAVLRTFSKAFAFAGARCGYVLCSPVVASGLSAVRQPYSVDAVVQAMALEAVRHRADFMPTVEAIRADRARLIEAVRAIPGASAWESDANFVLVRVPQAHEVYLTLRDERSILVRDFSSTPGLENCLRITVGTPAENAAVTSALSELCSAYADDSRKE